jgi:hypothetical protein
LVGILLDFGRGRESGDNLDIDGSGLRRDSLPGPGKVISIGMSKARPTA